jgi:hypothetical protein
MTEVGLTKLEQHAAAYTAKMRVSVRAGDITIVREGSGTGAGRAPTPRQAHELALKGAETDATKRALATFGNPFGLALYDREQAGVRKTRSGQVEIGPWVLRSSTSKPLSSHDTSRGFIEALKKAMSEADGIELLYDLWEVNIETLRLLDRSSNERPGIVPTMVSPCGPVPSISSSGRPMGTLIHNSRGTAFGLGSTRASLRLVSRDASAQKSTSASWQASLA